MTETDLQLWDACLVAGLCDEPTLERAKVGRAAAVGLGASMDLLGALAADNVLSRAQVNILRRVLPEGGGVVPPPARSSASRSRSSQSPSSLSPSPASSAPRRRSLLENVEADPSVEGLALFAEDEAALERQRTEHKRLAPLPLDASLPAPDAVEGVSFSGIAVGVMAVMAIATLTIGAVYILPELAVPDTPEIVDDPVVDTDSAPSVGPAMLALNAAVAFAEQNPDRIVETRERLDALENAHADALGVAIEDARVRAEDAYRTHRAARLERLKAKSDRLADAGNPVAAALEVLDFPDDLRAGPDGEKWAEMLADALQCVRKKTGMALVPAGPAPSGSESPGKPVAAFLIDLTEVSNSAYAEFVAATGAPAPAHWRNDRPTTMLTSRPVVGITVAEAKAYAHWAGKRLPSVVEWQLAAAGPESWPYPWGETYDASRCRAALGDKATPSGLAPTRTHSDGRALCGAYHLVGNAAEWVAGVTTSDDGRVLHLALGGSAIAEKPHTFQRDTYAGDTNDPALLIGFRCVKDAR